MKHRHFFGIIAILLVAAVIATGCTSSSRPIRQGQSTGVPTSPPTGQSVSVPYGEDVKVSLDSPATSEVYLTMNARADSRDIGGGRSFMKIRVNGENITGERLVNKNMNFTYGDGFKTAYYSRNMSAWYLFFSPNFTVYDNPGYRDHILEGNAYAYKFDVSNIVNKGAPNEIVLSNIGDEVAAQYSDPKTIEYYKSATIIVNPISLVGKGAEVVRVTKNAAPTRIIVGKKSTMTLTITNNLAGNITDIGLTDSPLPDGLSGQILTGQVEKPILSGESYSVTYQVTAEKVGTYTLGSATATFADPTGNYQKISTGTVSISVI